MKKVSVEVLDQWGGRIVDVRTRDEFACERLARAECVPLDGLLSAAAQWDRAEPVLLMCKSGMRSAQGVQRLENQGFTEVATLEGGIEACKRAGVEVIRERRMIPVFRQVMVAVGVVLLAGLFLARVDAHWMLLVWLMSAGLVFGGLTGYCPMAGLLARMPWNRVDAGTSEDRCCSGT